jgi:hypothetical protein
MDANGNVSVLLDSRLSHGSGSGDMALYVPESDFAGADAGSNVYLYSKMGKLAGANGGFEEWAVPHLSPVANGSLSGRVFFDANDDDGVFNPANGDQGLQGIVMQLSGVDINNNPVTPQSTPTAVDGTYSFPNVAPGTYTITEIPPGLYVPGVETVGSLGGNLNGTTQITGIVVGAGQNGVNYNFSHIFGGGG